MDSKIKTTELIVVKQLPVIVEQLHGIKAAAEEKVRDALSLACTEETVQIVKKRRAELNAIRKDLEARRAMVKKEIMAPYDSFMDTYKECVTDVFEPADQQLAQKIGEVQDGLKQEKAAKVVAYFNELQQSMPGLEWVQFEDIGISVTLSGSVKALKERVKAYMDKVSKDMECIRSMPDSLELMAEYKRVKDLPTALNNEHQRKMRIAAEQNASRRNDAQIRQEEAAAAVQEIVAEDAALQPPTAVAVEETDPVVDERKYSATFKVTDTLDRLRALKAWLEQEGYQYECN